MTPLLTEELWQAVQKRTEEMRKHFGVKTAPEGATFMQTTPSAATLPQPLKMPDAPKIAQKIRMFFENDRIDAGAGQKKPEHHPGGSAADDAAAAGECLRGLVHSPPSREAHRSTIRR